MSNKILILVANPRGDLKVYQEIRELRKIIERSDKRTQFEIEERVAVRPKDLQNALLKVQPKIIHFCGHGSGNDGLVLEDDLGQQQLVSTEAITDLFKLFTNQIECVVLNACYSKVQGQEIVKHINYVIGMEQDVRDDVAIAFTLGFYEALSSGETIESAYEFGCNRIQLEINRSGNYQTSGLVPVPEHLIPVLLKNPNPVVISSLFEEESKISSLGNNNRTNNAGIQQIVSGATVQGGIQASIGNNNHQSMQIDSNKSDEEKLTKEQVIQKLEQIEQLIHSASYLLVPVKKKSLRYLEAAKDEVLENKPDKEFAASNLKRMIETLRNSNQISNINLLETTIPILKELLSWLGVAKNFFGL